MTPIVKRDSSPIFNQKYKFNLSAKRLSTECIRFRAYHKRDKWAKIFIGEVSMDIPQLVDLATQNQPVWLPLGDTKSSKGGKKHRQKEAKAPTNDRKAVHIISQITFDPVAQNEQVAQVEEVKRARLRKQLAHSKSADVRDRVRATLLEHERASMRLASSKAKHQKLLTTGTFEFDEDEGDDSEDYEPLYQGSIVSRDLMEDLNNVSRQRTHNIFAPTPQL